MYKRLGEIFIDDYKNNNCNITKIYNNGKMVLAELFNPKSKKTVFIYDNSKYHDDDFVDADNKCFLEVHILEDKLSEENGSEAMTELLDYYLNDELYRCLCIKKDNCTELFKVNYDKEISVVNHVREFLIDIGVSDKYDNYDLATIILDFISNNKSINICGYKLYYDEIPKKEYEEAIEC